MNHITLIALACTAAPALAGAAVVPTVGVYDSQSPQTNFVDFIANTGGTSTATTGPGDSLNGFKPAVAAAYSNNFGGVYQFETPLGGDTVSGGIQAQYGVSASKTLNINTLYRAAAFGTSTEISGGAEGIFRTGAAGTGALDSGNGTFVFDSITGGATNEEVVSFGLTFLGRDGAGTVTGVATLSGGSTITKSAAIGSGLTQDTFFGFDAPSGQFLTQVAFTKTGRDKTFDDLGFVTAVIPEPASAGLAVAGLAGVLLRRRA